MIVVRYEMGYKEFDTVELALEYAEDISDLYDDVEIYDTDNDLFL